MWLMVLVMFVLLAATVAYVAPPLFVDEPEDDQTSAGAPGARRG